MKKEYEWAIWPICILWLVLGAAAWMSDIRGHFLPEVKGYLMSDINIKQFMEAMDKFLTDHPRMRVRFAPYLSDQGYRMRTSTWDVFLLPELWREEAKPIPEMRDIEWREFTDEFVSEHVTRMMKRQSAPLYF